jgi:hypothetical protein
VRRPAIRAALALTLALLAFLHFDPLSPWDPLTPADPTNVATPERRASMLTEYDYMIDDPWGVVNEPTREAVRKMQARMCERFPEDSCR